ncbi:MAG: hypothetical protein GXP52_05700 [Deltaproteobacteria bacterium]|nr:hypothetical protein [Deltaproteobacteria bacterium]
MDYYVYALGRQIARVKGTPGRWWGYRYEWYYYHSDYLNSVWAVSDAGGKVVWTKRYRPFGSEAAQSGALANDYQFAGKGFDAEANLYYFNAGWYDPDIGRFISEDPVWGNIRDPQSLNRFRYARNNPLKLTDPTGMYDDQDNDWDTENFGDVSDDGQDDDGYGEGGGDAAQLNPVNEVSPFRLDVPVKFLPSVLTPNTPKAADPFGLTDLNNFLEFFAKLEMRIEPYAVAGGMVFSGAITTACGVVTIAVGFSTIPTTGPAGVLVAAGGAATSVVGAGMFVGGMDIYSDQLREKFNLPEWFDLAPDINVFSHH